MRTKIARLHEVENQLASQKAQLDMARNQLQEGRDATVLINDLMEAGVVHRESDQVFVAKNDDGERRFDYQNN